MDEKEQIAAYMKLAYSTVFVCFNYYSERFGNHGFSSVYLRIWPGRQGGQETAYLVYNQLSDL